VTPSPRAATASRPAEQRPVPPLVRLVRRLTATVPTPGLTPADRLELGKNVQRALQQGRTSPIDARRETAQAADTLKIYATTTGLGCLIAHPVRSAREASMRRKGEAIADPVCWVQRTEGPEVARAEKILARLLAVAGSRPYPLEVTVFQKSDPNAFSAGGGRFGLHEGLLKSVRNEDELAFVLAHELAHDLHRDGEGVARALEARRKLDEAGKNLPRATRKEREKALEQAFLVAKRQLESEADATAIRMMSQAGFDPSRGLAFFERMPTAAESLRREEDLSHPLTTKRVAAMRAQIESEKLGPVPSGR